MMEKGGNSMMIRRIQAALINIGLLLSPSCFAETIPTIGALAENMIAGSSAITRLAVAACVVMGVGFIVASIAMYKTHRDNPKFVPLDRPIMFLIFGIIALSIPYFGQIFGKTGSVIDLHKEQAMQYAPVDIDAPLQ